MFGLTDSSRRPKLSNTPYTMTRDPTVPYRMQGLFVSQGMFLNRRVSKSPISFKPQTLTVSSLHCVLLLASMPELRRSRSTTDLGPSVTVSQNRRPHGFLCVSGIFKTLSAPMKAMCTLKPKLFFTMRALVQFYTDLIRVLASMQQALRAYT